MSTCEVTIVLSDSFPGKGSHSFYFSLGVPFHFVGRRSLSPSTLVVRGPSSTLPRTLGLSGHPPLTAVLDTKIPLFVSVITGLWTVPSLDPPISWRVKGRVGGWRPVPSPEVNRFGLTFEPLDLGPTTLGVSSLGPSSPFLVF